MYDKGGDYRLTGKYTVERNLPSSIQHQVSARLTGHRQHTSFFQQSRRDRELRLTRWFPLEGRVALESLRSHATDAVVRLSSIAARFREGCAVALWSRQIAPN